MKESTPYISVVCPLYNSEKYVHPLLTSLINQTYPKDKYEIICIDNGSTDKTIEFLKEYDIKILQESIQSSYAARNKGILHAKGDIIAFIDSDCIADNKWLAEGIKVFLSTNADMVSGNIEFFFKDTSNPWEALDSILHMNNKENFKKGLAATANLFVKKEVFKTHGLFNYHSQSGEDRAWTFSASKAGYKLQYAHNCRVLHPTRGKSELLAKAKRTGAGFLQLHPNKLLAFIFIIINLTPFSFKFYDIFKQSNFKPRTKIKLIKCLISVRRSRARGLLNSIWE